MVKILEFRRLEGTEPARETDGQKGDLPEGHSAEIVIFPGVRIERQSALESDDDHTKQAAEEAKRPIGRDR